MKKISLMGEWSRGGATSPAFYGLRSSLIKACPSINRYHLSSKTSAVFLAIETQLNRNAGLEIKSLENFN